MEMRSAYTKVEAWIRKVRKLDQDREEHIPKKEMKRMHKEQFRPCYKSLKEATPLHESQRGDPPS